MTPETPSTGHYGEGEALLDLTGIDWICDRIADGTTRRDVCAEIGVERSTLRRWLALDPARQRQFDAALKEAAAAFEEMADEEIANASDPFELAKAKERGYHWRWRASKANPQRYGDKTEITGPEGGPLQTESTLNVSGLSTEQLRALASIAVLPG